MADRNAGQLPLFLVLPPQRHAELPSGHAPPGFCTRALRLVPSGIDRERESFFDVQLSVDLITREAEWQALVRHALPAGVFVTRNAAGEPVATAAALHNPDARFQVFPGGGEVAWIAVHPACRRRGLGRAITAAAARRLIAAGYEHIRLAVRDDALPAICLYLSLGLRPLVHEQASAGRWRAVAVAAAGAGSAGALRETEWIRV